MLPTVPILPWYQVAVVVPCRPAGCHCSSQCHGDSCTICDTQPPQSPDHEPSGLGSKSSANIFPLPPDKQSSTISRAGTEQGKKPFMEAMDPADHRPLRCKDLSQAWWWCSQICHKAFKRYSEVKPSTKLGLQFNSDIYVFCLEGHSGAY